MARVHCTRSVDTKHRMKRCEASKIEVKFLRGAYLTVSVLTISPSQFPLTASDKNSSMGPVSPSSWLGKEEHANRGTGGTSLLKTRAA